MCQKCVNKVCVLMRSNCHLRSSNSSYERGDWQV